jgi:hypothetical protein
VCGNNNYDLLFWRIRSGGGRQQAHAPAEYNAQGREGLFIVGFRAMSGPSLLSSTPNQSKSMLLAATRGPVLQFPHFIGVIRTPITEVALPIPKVPKRAEAKGRGGVRSVQE